MARRIRKAMLIPPAAFLLIGGLLVFGSTGEDRQAGAGYLDRPLPVFAQPPLAGTGPGLTSEDLRGEVALINVFASWCTICRSEHPMLTRLGAEGEVALFGLNWKDAPGAGGVFLGDLGDPYRATGVDTDGRTGAALGVTGVPETYVIDAEGRIRYRHVGALTEEVWRDILGPLVRQLEAQS
ncbi:DsbE family thiol:disulfide interchange protein [uncultured Jannaschia sp.]|uniref:DsbE family thiol:disulfide interchange protein n=1 Tax=uncultured Jannaschia sp. TaxID=293347 RepID=UPI00261220CC|nr:DsbE family thiol:disulfide interchange protein [uncultured Jannaschia sp.]